MVTDESEEFRWPAACETRGQLRRLCAALGIALPGDEVMGQDELGRLAEAYRRLNTLYERFRDLPCLYVPTPELHVTLEAVREMIEREQGRME